MLKKGETYNWSIYRITSPSGRVYIGKSSNIAKRLSSYRNKGNKNQPLIYRSVCKYGIECHQIDVIDTFEGDISYAIDKEMFWIRSYMSNHCKWPEMRGLNLTDGGDGIMGHRHSEETRNRLSEYKKENPDFNFLNRRNTPEQIKKGADKRRGKPNAKRGKISEKVRLERIEKATKIKWASLKGVRPDKAIAASIIANTGRAPWNKGKQSELSELDRKKFYGGRNLGNKYNLGKKASDEMRMKMSVAKRKPVVCYRECGALVGEYESIKQAATEVGLFPAQIGSSLRGTYKNRKGLVFKYKK